MIGGMIAALAPIMLPLRLVFGELRFLMIADGHDDELQSST
jgi:hypothetical protein